MKPLGNRVFIKPLIVTQIGAIHLSKGAKNMPKQGTVIAVSDKAAAELGIKAGDSVVFDEHHQQLNEDYTETIVEAKHIMAILLPEPIKLGSKIKFKGEKQAYKVIASSSRYAVCNKPFNVKKTTLYTVIDWREKVRGTENLVFGMGAETPKDCQEMLDRLENGETQVSFRNRVPLKIESIVAPK
jgi:co-chaperonin GroES (HSP10)